MRLDEEQAAEAERGRRGPRSRATRNRTRSRAPGPPTRAGCWGGRLEVPQAGAPREPQRGAEHPLAPRGGALGARGREPGGPARRDADVRGRRPHRLRNLEEAEDLAARRARGPSVRLVSPRTPLPAAAPLRGLPPARGADRRSAPGSGSEEKASGETNRRKEGRDAIPTRRTD